MRVKTVFSTDDDDVLYSPYVLVVKLMLDVGHCS